MTNRHTIEDMYDRVLHMLKYGATKMEVGGKFPYILTLDKDHVSIQMNVYDEETIESPLNIEHVSRIARSDVQVARMVCKIAWEWIYSMLPKYKVLVTDLSDGVFSVYDIEKGIDKLYNAKGAQDAATKWFKDNTTLEYNNDRYFVIFEEERYRQDLISIEPAKSMIQFVFEKRSY